MSDEDAQPIAELVDKYEFIHTVEAGDEDIDEEIVTFSSEEAKEAFQAGWKLHQVESRAIPRPVLGKLLDRWWNQTLPREGSFSEAADELEKLIETYSERDDS